MRKIILLLAVLTMAFVFSSCGGGGSSAVKETPAASAQPTAAAADVKMPEMKADPNVYPLISALYAGGEENGAKCDYYIWNGCKLITITNAAEGFNGSPIYWKVKVGLGVDWFGWGVHPKDPKSRDMKGFENGHLKFGLRAKAGSSTIKILVKHGYATESWQEVTPALGWAADGKWHEISISLKDYTPKIKFGIVNIPFAMAQQQVPPTGGSEYDIAEVRWTKD